jgi:hypothetical protein
MTLFARLQSCMVGVLVRVGGLVFQKLDEFVEASSNEGAKGGTEPVDFSYLSAWWQVVEEIQDDLLQW